MHKIIRLFMDFIYLQADKLARRDSLTGLLNHQYTRKQLSEALKIAKRRNGSAYVILIDIDHFKVLNDRHGHPVGDEVIRTFTRIIGGSRRTGEHAGRIGGEEFLVILQNADLKEAITAAERILKDVRNARVSIGAGKVVRFRVSLGIAGHPLDGLTADQLIEKADKALYTAKFRGRDRYVVWSPKIDSELTQHRAVIYAE